MRAQVTPLKIWGWVGTIFVLSQFLVVLFFLKTKVNQHNNERYFNQINYIHEEFKKESSSYKTIIIGSSLIGHGVECSDEITTYISSKKSSDIKLLKIWDGNDPLKNFISLNLINEIIKAKPNLVLIQTDLATINTTKNKGSKNIIQELSFINRSVIRYLFTSKRNTTNSLKNGCYPENINRQVALDTLNHIPYKRETKVVDDLAFAFEGLARLQKEGIKTILVDVPRPAQSEKIIYTKPFKEKLQKLFDMYNKSFGIEHWSYTGTPIYFKQCIDHGHFNIEGRSIYTKWLLNKIEQQN